MKPQRLVFGETLTQLGNEYQNLVVCDADVSSSTQTKIFGAKFPERFFNFGISEGNMVSAAAGMAATGMISVVSTFALFLALRAGDPVRSLIAYNSLNVKIAGGYAGLSDFADGASHQSVEDMAVMQAIPNIKVLCPSDITTTAKAVKAMLEYQGPVYLRLSREAISKEYDDNINFEIGKGIIVNDGDDVTIIACGIPMRFARIAVKKLKEKGINVRLIDMPTVKPLDAELIAKAAEETGAIVTVEEHNIFGGLGSSVASLICETNPVPVVKIGVPDKFGESGNYEEILSRAGISVEDIIEATEKAIRLKAK